MLYFYYSRRPKGIIGTTGATFSKHGAFFGEFEMRTGRVFLRKIKNNFIFLKKNPSGPHFKFTKKRSVLTESGPCDTNYTLGSSRVVKIPNQNELFSYLVWLRSIKPPTTFFHFCLFQLRFPLIAKKYLKKSRVLMRGLIALGFDSANKSGFLVRELYTSLFLMRNSTILGPQIESLRCEGLRFGV